jgi:ribosomal protein S14
MAIKYQKKLKDKKNRLNYLKNEKTKKYLKFVSFKYQKLLNIKDFTEKKKAIILLRNINFKLQAMPKNKINNFCILTGRDKGVYRDFRLSRHQIRGNFKFLTGLRNSSF